MENNLQTKQVFYLERKRIDRDYEVIKDGKVLGIYKSASEVQRISLSEFGVMLWQTQISL